MLRQRGNGTGPAGGPPPPPRNDSYYGGRSSPTGSTASNSSYYGGGGGVGGSTGGYQQPQQQYQASGSYGSTGYGGYYSDSSTYGAGGGNNSSNGYYGSSSFASSPTSLSSSPTSKDSKMKNKKKRRSSSFLQMTADVNFSSLTSNPAVLLLGIIVIGIWSLIVLFLWFKLRGAHYGLLKEFSIQTPMELQELVTSLKRDLRYAERQVEKAKRDATRKYTSQINTMERENRLLQKERDELRVKYENPNGNNDGEDNELSRLEKRDEAFQDQVHWLQEATRKESRRTVLERFGSGPYHVKMVFELPTSDDSKELNEFVLEMAPLDLVPHAVHLFLEQVAHGLWNHTFFYLNGPHIVQGGPALDEEEEEDEEHEGNDGDRSSSVRPFQDLGLDELAFPDYSDEYPHLPWTMGFTGRPGGPDFYINKVDNSESHGPGGQTQHVLEEQGDPCFAKVIRGQEQLAKVYSQSIYGDRSDWHWFLREPVEIISAEIVGYQNHMEEQVQASPSSSHSNHHATTTTTTASTSNSNNDPVRNVQEKLHKHKQKLPNIEHRTEA